MTPDSTRATRSASGSRKVLVVVGVLVLAGALGLFVWSGSDAVDDAAHDAAERYVELIATGDADDLAELPTLTADETAALADAGDLLASADERIQVQSVGEPEPGAEPADLSGEVDLDDFREVEVRYTLDGKEHTWTLVLGRVADEDGDESTHWRIAAPMVGSIAWDEPGFLGEDTEIQVNRSTLDRRPRLRTEGRDDVQPLYPAVYDARKRLAPYFRSPVAQVAVTAGEPTAQPTLELTATSATAATVRRSIKDRAAACGTEAAFSRCPFFDLVEDAGVDPYREGWWGGFVGAPRIEVDSGIRITGTFRYVGTDGVRTLDFTGTGTFGWNTRAGAPTIATLEVEGTR